MPPILQPSSISDNKSHPSLQILKLSHCGWISSSCWLIFRPSWVTEQITEWNKYEAITNLRGLTQLSSFPVSWTSAVQKTRTCRVLWLKTAFQPETHKLKFAVIIKIMILLKQFLFALIFRISYKDQYSFKSPPSNLTQLNTVTTTELSRNLISG